MSIRIEKGITFLNQEENKLAKGWLWLIIFLVILAGIAFSLILFNTNEFINRANILKERLLALAPGTVTVEGNSCQAALPISNDHLTGALPAGEVESAVGKWELYEIELTSTQAYNNPFTDVDVYADFVSPSGNRTIRVYGFYDGNGNGGQGNLWKIRFMGDEIGTWSWATTSTDASNNGLHNQSGSVQIVSSNGPGPLYPDPAIPNAWRHAEGDYSLWNLGYSIHMAGADRNHPGVGGWQDYLNWLEDHRFNGVLFLLQVGSFDACTTCAAGMAPWSAIGNNSPPTYAFNNNNKVDYFVMPWAQEGDPNDFATTNSNVDYERFYLPLWQNVDEILVEMQEKKMIAHVWQYDDQTFHPAANSPEEKLYWDYIIRRLGAHWNVVFNDGIDLFEYRSNSWVDVWQQYYCNNMPFYHALSSRHGNDNNGIATFRSVQSPSPNDINGWRNQMAMSPQMPLTEDDGVRALKDNGIPPDRFMQLAWWSTLSGEGAYGVTWAGAHDPANWFSNLNSGSEGMLRVEIRNRFVLDFDPANNRLIPFWKLAPDDTLVNGQNIFAAADQGNHYLVFFDDDSPNSTVLDLTGTSQSWPITWLNPYNGQVIEAGNSTPGSMLNLENPFNGEAVLYVGEGEAADSPPDPTPFPTGTPGPTETPCPTATRSITPPPPVTSTPIPLICYQAGTCNYVPLLFNVMPGNGGCH